LKLAQKAVEALQKALVLQGPDRIRGYYQLALAWMDLGKLDEAENALREILAVPVSGQRTA
jgi:tetratricopeptide (TPR) repeat protein